MSLAKLVSRAILGAAVMEGVRVGNYETVARYVGVAPYEIVRWQIGMGKPSPEQEEKLKMLEYVIDSIESIVEKTKANLAAVG